MSKLKYYDGTNWKVVNGQITGDTLPIGAIVPYGTTTAPTNWLVCDGSAVSRTTYAELFAVIGTSFGSGDGSTTFNLPNLKGKVAVGQDTNDTDFDTIGETGGSKELQAHRHEEIDSNYGGELSSFTTAGTKAIYDLGSLYQENKQKNSTMMTGTAGTGNSGNLQPYQVVCYIIKAKQSAGVVANVSNTYSTSETDTYSCDYINGDIIYDNTNGTSTDFTLDSTINNYRYVEVYYRTNDANSMSCKKAQVQYNATTLMSLDYCYILSNALYYKCANISINGTAATFTGNSQVLLNGSLNPSAGNYVFVFKIIGYK